MEICKKFGYSQEGFCISGQEARRNHNDDPLQVFCGRVNRTREVRTSGWTSVDDSDDDYGSWDSEDQEELFNLTHTHTHPNVFLSSSYPISG